MTSSIGMDPVDVALTNERNGYSSFGADFTPSPEAIDTVNEAFDFIEANPEKWNQDFYGNESSAQNCFMGILCRLNGYTASINYGDYHLYQAMDILGMDGTDHEDRANYIALFVDVRNSHGGGWRELTLKDMRERVSIAMNHDFRKNNNTKALNDPTVDCCERDAADCDCPDKPALTVGENGPYPQPYNEV